MSSRTTKRTANFKNLAKSHKICKHNSARNRYLRSCIEATNRHMKSCIEATNRYMKSCKYFCSSTRQMQTPQESSVPEVFLVKLLMKEKARKIPRETRKARTLARQSILRVLWMICALRVLHVFLIRNLNQAIVLKVS